MDPRLAALQGPLKGTDVVIHKDSFTIGRENSQHLALQDPKVSRRHARIEKQGESWRLVDLDSTNGTYVNGVPVKERRLHHGDRLGIGGSEFLFLSSAEEADIPVDPVRLEDGKSFHTTIQLQLEDALYLQGDVSRAGVSVQRSARDLQALLKISRVINSVRTLDELLRRVLELAAEVIPTERGAILLGKDPERCTEITAWRRQDSVPGPVSVSRTVLRQVFDTSTAVLCSSVSSSELLKKANSLAGLGVEAVLCVPLKFLDQLLGVLYLESTDPSASFDETHLQFAGATASLAAVAIENVRQLEWLQSEKERLQEDIRIEHSMVGESPPMRKVYEFIARVAPSDSSVLITGENGTGKELAARAIHQNSPRAGKPFVAINCATLTETLLESELFGHEKGAFTGAVRDKKGKLEIADGGTVLLDEIGELAPELQVKLLRFLQEHEFERVGGTRPIRVDLRMIACTNRNLEEALEQGEFRQDLYYRLNVISLRMPPLRERGEDILLLAQHFAARYSKRCGRPVMGISQEAREYLLHYNWPGNVRELQNAIERAVVMGTGDVILPEDLPEAVLETERPRSQGKTYHEALRERKKELIIRAVEEAGGNYTEAARRLDLHPNYLHRLIRNLNLKETLKQIR